LDYTPILSMFDCMSLSPTIVSLHTMAGDVSQYTYANYLVYRSTIVLLHDYSGTGRCRWDNNLFLCLFTMLSGTLPDFCTLHTLCAARTETTFQMAACSVFFPVAQHMHRAGAPLRPLRGNAAGMRRPPRHAPPKI